MADKITADSVAASIEPIVEYRDISKRFGTSVVLDGIRLSLYPGRVTALMGENGAGKSTMLGILAGLLAPSQGTIAVDGKTVVEYSPNAGQARGIEIVTQELSLVPHLTVAENIFLGRELTGWGRMGGFLQSSHMLKEAQDAINEFDIPVSASDRIEQISLSYAQIVEIIRAWHRRPRILLLDEPTSSLTRNETRHLFEIVKRLRTAGTAVVFTTHKMDEVEQMADDIAVLRDGQITLTAPIEKLSSNEIISAMVGRELAEQHLELPEVTASKPALAVSGYATRQPDEEYETGFAFSVRPGEIVGLAGIAGSGRTAFFKSVYGLHPARTGEVVMGGQNYDNRSPSASLKRGLIYIPENRKEAGLVLSLDIAQNTILSNLTRFTGPGGWVRRGREENISREALESLRTKYGGARTSVASLSGGNQQKVLVARCLIADSPQVLLLDEPTRGIDVGAKADIYEIIVDLAQRGIAIVVSSSELPELMTLSHRIAVFREGALCQTFERHEFDEKEIVRAAIGA
ncbi:monosaccharide ABC transporter ATP-binding protein (CUT2 family) [Kushneria sinocarnis]|uniref:Monosaccharide ABC transporter ATP-binding protein (CUT2 family) n=1 Tax=Kushneria sinocarnis TaxID=595502 RepID=A0A420X1G9_9GAMM|nr:sugar ABC transporter ATP-binding protein [Kushneria sinocarnis]RKR07693.1 monosaccharide ABC transporter ATP-binding protein (CUT2 family) [Kushneria sinocarnis]